MTRHAPAVAGIDNRQVPSCAVDRRRALLCLLQHLTHLQRRIPIATKDRQFIRAITDCRFQQSQIDWEEFFSTFDENGLSP
jgi:hypothetical protein